MDHTSRRRIPWECAEPDIAVDIFLHSVDADSGQQTLEGVAVVSIDTAFASFADPDITAPVFQKLITADRRDFRFETGDRSAIETTESC